MKIDKRLFLLGFLIFLFIFPNHLIAQPGIKTGLVLSGFPAWQDLDPYTGNDFRMFLGYEVDWLQEDGSPDFGLQIGIFYSKDISRYFAIQPELNYVQKGMHFYKIELYNSSYSLNVAYLELPLLLKYKLPVEWQVKPSLLAGPYTAFKLSAKRTLQIWEESDTKSISGMKNFDYGIVFAINTSFTAWSKSMMFEIRLNWGLANVMKQPEAFTSLFDDAGKVNVVAFNLMTGMQF